MVKINMSTLSPLVIFWIFAVGVYQCEARIVNFTDCGSKEGKIVNFDITPCDVDPCVVKRGTDESATLTFVALEYLTSLHLKVWAIIEGYNIPVPLPTDACEGYGFTCPIKAQQTARFSTQHYIDKGFPTGNITIKTELIDPEENIVVCFEFPVTLK